MSINLGVQWWQSCDNSYNFNQMKIFFTQIERENRYVLYTFKKQNYFPFFSKPVPVPVLGYLNLY